MRGGGAREIFLPEPLLGRGRGVPLPLQPGASSSGSESAASQLAKGPVSWPWMCEHASGIPRSRVRQSWAPVDTSAPGWVVLLVKEEPSLGVGRQDPCLRMTSSSSLGLVSSPVFQGVSDSKWGSGLIREAYHPQQSLGGLHPSPFLPQTRERTLHGDPGAQTGGRVGPGEASGPGGAGWGLQTVLGVSVLTLRPVVGVGVAGCPPIQNR